MPDFPRAPDGVAFAGAFPATGFFAAVEAALAVAEFAAAGFVEVAFAAALAVFDFAAPDGMGADLAAADFATPDFAVAAGFSVDLRLREVLLEVTMSVSFQKITSG